MAGVEPSDAPFLEPGSPRAERVVSIETAIISLVPSASSLDDVRAIVRADAADALNVYVGKAGGMERALRQLSIGAAFGLGGIIGSNGEMGLGAAAQIHVACAAPQLGPFPSDIVGHLYYDEDILATSLPIGGGVASLPTGAGLGVEPSPRLRADFTV